MSLKDRLQRSKANRQAMLNRYGFIPRSVLRLARGALSKEMFIYQHEKRDRSASYNRKERPIMEVSEEKREEAKERKAMGLLSGRMGVSVRDAKRWKQYKGQKSKAAADLGENIPIADYSGNSRLQASTMPAELVDFFLKYYAEPGQVYLDPFMGQGIQLQVAKLRGLHYYGYDCSREFCAYINEVVTKIDDGATTIRAICGDSRCPDEIPDGIGDFSFHSPPYWDIEYYGDETAQLGQGTYPDFLDGMEAVARAWLPKFKTGAFHVVNVNDFRRQGKFYPYHADTVALFCRAGWQFYDTWIIDGLVGGLPKAFAVDFNMKRIAPKVHEYALVFRKE